MNRKPQKQAVAAELEDWGIALVNQSPEPMKSCPQCSQPTALDTANCSRCGHQFRTRFVVPASAPEPTRLHYTPDMPPAPRPGIIQVIPGTHSFTAAVVGAVLFTGIGQMVNRQYGKAGVLLLAAILTAFPTLYVGPMVIWGIALADAIVIANRLQRGEAVGAWQCF